MKSLILSCLLMAGLPAVAEVAADSVSVLVAGVFSPWEGFNQETEQAKAKATQSYDQACRQWKLDSRRLLGSKLKFIECGRRRLEQVGPSLSLSHTLKFEPYLLGNLASSSGSLLINVPQGFALGRLTRTISGESFSFNISDFNSVRSALAKARDSYLQRCAEWRAEVVADFDDSLVYASCGSFIQGDSPTLSNAPGQEWRARFQLSSEGTIAYFQVRD